MTKREQHSAINKAFYEFVNSTFPNYEIDSSEGYGRIFLRPKSHIDLGEVIEYHQSQHSLSTYNWADNETRENIINMEIWINEFIRTNYPKL